MFSRLFKTLSSSKDGNKPDMSVARKDQLRAMLQQSQVGRDIDTFIEDHLRCVEFDAGMTSAGTYSGRYNVIFLNPWLSDEYLIEVIFHEARHARQDQLGLNCYDGLGYDDAVFLRRVLEADAYSYGTYALWTHSHDIGDPEMFDRVMKANGHYELENQMRQTADEPTDTIRMGMFDVFFSDLKYVIRHDQKKVSTLFKDFDKMSQRANGRLNLGWLAYNIGQPMADINTGDNYLTAAGYDVLNDKKYWRGLDRPKGGVSAVYHIPQKPASSNTNGRHAA